MAGDDRLREQIGGTMKRAALAVAVVAGAVCMMSASAGASAPVLVQAPEIWGAATVGEELRSRDGRWSSTTPVDRDHQWLRCDSEGGECRAIEGADTDQLQLTAGDIGQRLRVKVTATNPSGSTEEVSAASAVVAAVDAPEADAPPTAATWPPELTLVPGLTLRADSDVSRWHPRLGPTIDHVWQRCDAAGERCAAIEGATSPSYTLAEADAGKTVRVQVTSENAGGEARTTSDETAVVHALETPELEGTLEAPYVSPLGEDLHEGLWLVADPGEWGPFSGEASTVNSEGGRTYRWLRCDGAGAECRAIEGATDDTFHVRDTDEGGTLRVVVTATNGSGRAEAASNPTDEVGPMNAPVVDEPPTVFTVPREGWPLTPDRGTWDGGTPMTFAYQWLRCDEGGEGCADIEGAGERVYMPVAADVDRMLVVRVRATNDAGSDDATSEPFFAVQPGEPRWAERLAIAGDLVEGGEAEADLGGLRGTAPFEMTYQWIRCDEVCEPIEGATGARYEPVTADVGARLRLVATADNEWGEARSRSQLSAPVEPAAAEAGPPRSVERPRLDGYPRVSETVGSTAGEWRGVAPIGTTLQWQRCGATAETCTDISGATEAEYEVDSADEGSRLRTVVVATNERGRETAVSLLSPPMKPAVNTAFVLDEAVALTDVAAGIRAAGAPVMSVDYDGPSLGGFSAGGYGDDVEAVLDFFDAPWNLAGLELPITRFTLAGDVATSALGELEAQVDARVEVPSIKVSSSGSELMLLSEEEEGEPLIDEYISAARVWAYGADCDYPCDEADWERWWPQSDIPAFPRVIDVSFTWRPNRDLQQRIEEEERGFAWEFDLKLHNGENGGLPWGIACFPWDTNDFWIADRNAAMVDTTMPSEAGAYWDTDATDSCDEKDLTFGVYHPERLEYGHTYQVKIYLMSAGDEEQSTVTWGSQMLERRLTFAGLPCDISPWCVNVPPFNDVGEGRTLIEKDLGFSFPGCYEYNDRMRGSAEKCLFPE